MAVRAGRISDYLVNAWMAQLNTTANYVALFSSDPYAVQTPSTVEIVGASYARFLAATTLSGRLMTLTSAMSFQGIAAGGQVAFLGAFDAAFNGNFLWAGPVPGGPFAYPTGGSLAVAANSVHVGLDS